MMQFVQDENDEAKKTEILKRISELSFIKKKHGRNRKSTASSVVAGDRERTADKNTGNVSDFTRSKCESATHRESPKSPNSAVGNGIQLRADKNMHRRPETDEHRCRCDSENTPPLENHPGAVPKSDIKLSVIQNRPSNDENERTKSDQGDSFFRKIPVTSDHYRKFGIAPSERRRLANEMRSHQSGADTHCGDYRTSGVDDQARKDCDSKTRALHNMSRSDCDSPSPVIKSSSVALLPQTGEDDNNNKPNPATGPLAVENSNLNPNVAAFVPVYCSSSDYASMVANLSQSMSPGTVFIIQNNALANAHQVPGQLVAVAANGNAQLASHQPATVVNGSGNATISDQPQPPAQPATATIQTSGKEKRRVRVGYVLNRKPKNTEPKPASAESIINPKSSLDTDVVKTLNHLDAMRLNSMRVDVPTNNLSDCDFSTGTLQARKKVAPSDIVTDESNEAPLVPASDQLSLIANQLEAGVQTASPLWFHVTPSQMSSTHMSTVEILNENNVSEKPPGPKPIVKRKMSWPKMQPVTAYSEAGTVDSAYWMRRDSTNRTEPQYAPFQPKTSDQSQIQSNGTNSMNKVTDDLFATKGIQNNLPPSKFVQHSPTNASAEPPYIQPQSMKSNFVASPSISDMVRLVQESVRVQNLSCFTDTPPPPLPVHGVSLSSTTQPLMDEFVPPGRKQPYSMSSGQPEPTNAAPSPSTTDVSFAQQCRSSSKAPYQSESVSNGKPLSGHAVAFPSSSFARQFHNTEAPFQSERASNGKPLSPGTVAAPPTSNFIPCFAGARAPYQSSEHRPSSKPLSVNKNPNAAAQRFAVLEAPRSFQELKLARESSSVETAAHHQSAECRRYSPVLPGGRFPPGTLVSYAGAQFETSRRLSAGNVEQPHQQRAGSVEPSSGPQYHQPPPNDRGMRFGRVPPGFEGQPLPEPPAIGILKYPPQVLECDIGFSLVQRDTNESREYVNSCPKRVTFAPDDGSSS